MLPAGSFEAGSKSYVTPAKLEKAKVRRTETGAPPAMGSVVLKLEPCLALGPIVGLALGQFLERGRKLQTTLPARVCVALERSLTLECTTLVWATT